MILLLLFKLIKSLYNKSFKGINSTVNSTANINQTLNSTTILNSILVENTKLFYLMEKLNRTYKTKNKLLWNDTEPNFEQIRAKIKSYENFSVKINITKKEELYKRENPKISIIITVYNQEKYLQRVYCSILDQDFKDIEIIFVDDASTDNSSNIIKEFMFLDKRIVYLKNDINRRTYYSRSRGINSAKGEYILIIDADDFIFNNILIKTYETSQFFDLDILQFYMFKGSNELLKEVKYKDGILYQPKIKDIFYYGFGRNLADKLIKREIFIKALNFMDEKYRNERFQIMMMMFVFLDWLMLLVHTDF